MRFIWMGVLGVIIAVSASYAGWRIGLSEGANQYFCGNGLLRAEMARHMLVALDKGDVAEVKGLLHSDVLSGLNQHYDLMHYPRPLLLQDEAKYIFNDGHDKEFVRRLSLYVSRHPEVFDMGYRPEQLPENTEEERLFKQQSMQGQAEFLEHARWVLSQPVGQGSSAQK